MDKLIFKSYNDLIQDIKNNIHKISHQKFDLVVGIPRSGMIPAYLISAYLNIDCTDVNSLINNYPLQKGITRITKGNLNLPRDAKKILLVDDSIYSGKSLKNILDKIPDDLKFKITTLSIYSSEKNNRVDIYFEYLDGAKSFEWAIFHNKSIVCFDIDGVICRDATIEENDDGPKYLNFIRTAEPLFLPTGKIFALVSNRLEKYRSETEKWLKKHNVEYENLILLNLDKKEDRLKIDAAIEHKGKFYKQATNSVLFIESSFNQSVSIAKTSGKPVYCVEKNMFIDPSIAEKIIKNTRGTIKMYLSRMKHKIKKIINR